LRLLPVLLNLKKNRVVLWLYVHKPPERKWLAKDNPVHPNVFYHIASQRKTKLPKRVHQGLNLGVGLFHKIVIAPIHSVREQFYQTYKIFLVYIACSQSIPAHLEW